MPTKKSLLKLILAILICQSAGWIGSIFTTPSIQTWYATLTKPSFNPPNWVFAPVWTFLFLTMGVALWLIWRGGFKTLGRQQALRVFIIQLCLNVLWSLVFFGLHQPGIALIEILLLWLAILITIIKFYKIDRWAGLILIPYIAWVSFAAVLNLMLWRLN